MSVLTFLRSYISHMYLSLCLPFPCTFDAYLFPYCFSPLCVLSSSALVHFSVCTLLCVYFLPCAHSSMYAYTRLCVLPFTCILLRVYSPPCTPIHFTVCNLHWMYNKIHYVYIMCTVFNVYSIVFHADSSPFVNLVCGLHTGTNTSPIHG